MKIYKKDLINEHIGVRYYELDNNFNPRHLEIVDINPFTARDIHNDSLIFGETDYIDLSELENKMSRQFLDPLIERNRVVLLVMDLEAAHYAYPGLMDIFDEEVIFKPTGLDNLSPCLNTNYVLHLVGRFINKTGKPELYGISLKLGVIKEFIILDEDLQEIWDCEFSQH